MNKRTIFLFVLVVSLGLFLINSFIFGIEEKDCSCIDSQALWAECEGACMAFGGCDEPWVQDPGKCCGIMACEHGVINWCQNPPDKYVIGFHMAFTCWDCGEKT